MTYHVPPKRYASVKRWHGVLDDAWPVLARV
jgi:hypothetical protein